MSDAAKRDYKDLPGDVQRTFGFDLWQVQQGNEPSHGKVLKGFGGADVWELRDNDEAGTYRAVYTVRFEEALYVLHAFQKKSRKGITTAKADVDMIKRRLKEAEAKHQAWVREQKEGLR